MAVTLHGYSYSVYLRIARMTMLEKGVAWSHVEVDPFADEIPPDYRALNPFGRVPTLDHDGFVLYETTAITRYIDEAFEGPRLQPETPRERARMNQIIAIADSYGYWPMVRQVFSQRVFNARRRTPDEAVTAEGLARSRKVLAALEPLIGGSNFLVGDRLSLADLHLGAMTAYFTAAKEGAAALGDYPKLGVWWKAFKNRKSLTETDPGLPDD
ncbi:glutathione S-transferase family protein [Allomesorhizobium camelthorni]|uniref:glutathione transferase n=1 Tax=Allomesorhizobium camelthorni TaxID=475069 RepID=A0A6G4WH19_9HYPH|nr:glutathione S-transferase family protein [Mesorhizobium camelthorni]NGO53516.1 glutathione S-transferase family protein [Mesorhizobium camelthorni]